MNRIITAITALAIAACDPAPGGGCLDFLGEPEALTTWPDALHVTYPDDVPPWVAAPERLTALVYRVPILEPQDTHACAVATMPEITREQAYWLADNRPTYNRVNCTALAPGEEGNDEPALGCCAWRDDVGATSVQGYGKPWIERACTLDGAAGWSR